MAFRTTSMYGLTVGMVVEWLDTHTGRYEHGELSGFTRQGAIMVTHKGNALIFNNPRKLRIWKAPRTVEEVDRYLNGET